jgi:CHAT domain
MRAVLRASLELDPIAKDAISPQSGRTGVKIGERIIPRSEGSIRRTRFAPGRAERPEAARRATATALLMLRSYENLLGRGEEKPLPSAEALAEAKWRLRGLPLEEAKKLADALVRGRLAGTTRGSVLVLVPMKEHPPELPEGDRPFTHPTHWPAFVLVGAPR